jgi:hypothetical protein
MSIETKPIDENLDWAWLVWLDETYELKTERVIVLEEPIPGGGGNSRLHLYETGEDYSFTWVIYPGLDPTDKSWGERIFKGRVVRITLDPSEANLRRIRMRLIDREIDTIQLSIEVKKGTISYLHELKKKEFTNVLLKEL